jgi:CheY-like chemotaxis protein
VTDEGRACRRTCWSGRPSRSSPPSRKARAPASASPWCKGFVQQSLGRLEVESELGRGTTIRMIFPVAVEGAVPAQKSAAEAAPLREDPRGSAETILVVEDNDDVLALAREHLSGLGYRVLVAGSGDEGLRVFEREGDKVDLVFTDIVMPGGVNGVVLAREVGERRPEVPVLLTTGYNEELVADGPRATASEVLGKPYSRTQLADRVRAALNARKRGDRPPPCPSSRQWTGPRGLNSRGTLAPPEQSRYTPPTTAPTAHFVRWRSGRTSKRVRW